jgi:hypothetical protein
MLNDITIQEKLCTYLTGIISDSGISLTRKLIDMIHKESPIDDSKKYIQLFSRCAVLAEIATGENNQDESWSIDALEKMVNNSNA